MILTNLIEEGVRQKLFKVEEPRITSFAILSLMSGVCYWYRADGRVLQADLINQHIRMVFQLLGVDGAGKAKSKSAKPAAPRKSAQLLPRARGSAATT